jgi:hypothetical protein
MEGEKPTQRNWNEAEEESKGREKSTKAKKELRCAPETTADGEAWNVKRRRKRRE